MLHFQEKAAPLKRNVTQEEVGTAALSICSATLLQVSQDRSSMWIAASIIGMHVDDEAEATPAA